MSLTRNIALEKKVEDIVPEANELADYWTGTLLATLILRDLKQLVAVTKQHDYKNVYPLYGKLKKKLAEARFEQERAINESDQLS